VKATSFRSTLLFKLLLKWYNSCRVISLSISYASSCPNTMRRTFLVLIRRSHQTIAMLRRHLWSNIKTFLTSARSIQVSDPYSSVERTAAWYTLSSTDKIRSHRSYICKGWKMPLSPSLFSWKFHSRPSPSPTVMQKRLALTVVRRYEYLHNPLSYTGGWPDFTHSASHARLVSG